MLHFVAFRCVSVENSVETAKCDSILSMYCVHRSVDANVTKISKFLYKLYIYYIHIFFSPHIESDDAASLNSLHLLGSVVLANVMRQLLCIRELAPGKEGHVIRCHTAVCCLSPAAQTMQGTPRQELYSLPVDIPSEILRTMFQMSPFRSRSVSVDFW